MQKMRQLSLSSESIPTTTEQERLGKPTTGTAFGGQRSAKKHSVDSRRLQGTFSPDFQNPKSYGRSTSLTAEHRVGSTYELVTPSLLPLPGVLGSHRHSHSHSSSIGSGGSSSHLSSTGSLPVLSFDRTELKTELSALSAQTCQRNFLIQRGLLLQILTEPSLQGFRDRTLAHLKKETQALPYSVDDKGRVVGDDLTTEQRAQITFKLLLQQCALSPELSKKLAKKDCSKPKHRRVLDPVIKQAAERLDTLFPAFHMSSMTCKNMWDEKNREVFEGRAENPSQTQLQGHMDVLSHILGYMVSAKGLQAGEITNPAGHQPPSFAVPDIPLEDGEYFIPTKVRFTLDGVKMKVPEEHYRDIAASEFLRLHRAKELISTSYDEMDRLSEHDQKMLSGEIINDDNSLCSDAYRFDCQVKVVAGRQLPPVTVFSSQQYVSEYDKANRNEHREGADYQTPFAAGQQLVAVLKHVGGLSDSEISAVRGMMTQGSLNEPTLYFVNRVFPDRDILIHLFKTSDELGRNAPLQGHFEVIVWGPGQIEIRSSFYYDKYCASSVDRGARKYDADTRLSLSVRAKTPNNTTEISRADISLDIKRDLSLLDKLQLKSKREEFLAADKKLAAGVREYARKGGNEKKLEEALKSRFVSVADLILQDWRVLPSYVTDRTERTMVQHSIDGLDDKYEKQQAVIEALKKCQSLRLPELGSTSPLPGHLEWAGAKETLGVPDLPLDVEDSRAVYTENHGWVVTNLPSYKTEALEGAKPSMEQYKSREDIHMSVYQGGESTRKPSRSIQQVETFRIPFSEHLQTQLKSVKRMKKSVRERLCAYFKLDSKSKEAAIVPLIQEQCGSDPAQKGWEQKLLYVCSEAGIGMADMESVVAYMKSYSDAVYSSHESVTSPQPTCSGIRRSLPSLVVDDTTRTSPPTPYHRHSDSAPVDTSRLQSSDFTGNFPLSPVMEVKTPKAQVRIQPVFTYPVQPIIAPTLEKMPRGVPRGLEELKQMVIGGTQGKSREELFEFVRGYVYELVGEPVGLAYERKQALIEGLKAGGYPQGLINELVSLYDKNSTVLVDLV